MIINLRAVIRLLRRPAIRRLNRAAALVAACTLLASLANGASTDFTLYVANQNAYNSSPFTRYFTVEEFDALGNAGVFATNSSFSSPILSSPVSVAIDSVGNIYVACFNDGTWIEKFDPWGNNAARFVSPTVNYPNAMIFDSSGSLYVASGENSIAEYNSQGTGNVFASIPAAGQLVGLAFDATGNLYASDAYNDLIWRIDPQTNMTTFASPGHTPYGLAFDSAGNLYAALAGNGNIIKYSPPSSNETVVASLGSSTEPIGLAFDPAGNLYVSEYFANQIVKIDSNSNVTVFARAGLNAPSFMALQPKPYSVDRYVVAGGGGTSSGGIWMASGTAGQADAGIMAGQSMNGEIVGVEGGFWAGPVADLQVASTNLLANGSFELGSFVNQKGGDDAMQLYPGATNILGWTVTGAAGYDLSWMGPNDDLGLSAADGNYFLDLTGYHDAVPYDGVSQTVATTIGQRYGVSFEIGYSANYDNSTPAVSVAVTGPPTLTNSFAASGANAWQTFGFSFTASAASTVLTFTGATPENVEYIGLDHVIMWAVTSPPEIAVSAPSVSGGQLKVPFTFQTDSPVTFELLETTNLAGPWVTNSSASLTTITSNLSYFFALPTSGNSAFFRVKTP